MQVTATCPECAALIEASDRCPKCQGDLFPYRTEQFDATGKLEQCPVCGTLHLYRQKDFNRAIGVTVVVVGVLLAYWTYGVSLLGVALLDWFLFRRIGEVACCYRCGAQFRDLASIKEIEPFDLELHDYYRSLKRT